MWCCTGVGCAGWLYTSVDPLSVGVACILDEIKALPAKPHDKKDKFLVGSIVGENFDS